VRPVDRDVFLRPAIGTAAGFGRLIGPGHDGLPRSAGPAAGLGYPNDPRVPYELERGGALPPVVAWPDRTGEFDADPAQRPDTGHRSSTLRPGWYAYRVTGTAELPSWAVEIALTVERPGGLNGPGRPGSLGSWTPIPQSWVDASLDPFASETELRRRGPAQALVLLRAPGRLRWLAGIAEAIAEVETLAGIRPADCEDDLVEAMGRRRGPRGLTGPLLPGLTPVTAAVAAAHLRIAGSRGLPAPLRRRRPATGEVELAWRAGAGCVLTCDGPGGRSAQAVVALRGRGNAAAIAPPPGGALVLRAWRGGDGYGVACGLVLGASATLGLGREARRVAAAARSEGWDASVLSGQAAVQLAQSGSPRRPASRDVAQAASRTQVTALLQACLIAADLTGDLERQPSGIPEVGGDPLTTP
jgi:hypothetical protein